MAASLSFGRSYTLSDPVRFSVGLPSTWKLKPPLLDSGTRSLHSLGLVHDLPAHHRHHRLDVLDLVGGHFQVIAIEHAEVRVLARLDRAEIALLENEVRVAARVRDQRFLARDRLAVHLAPADHAPGHGETQGVERVRSRHGGRVRPQAPHDAAILHAPERRHVPGALAVHLVHERALDERAAPPPRAPAQTGPARPTPPPPPVRVPAPSSPSLAPPRPGA